MKNLTSNKAVLWDWKYPAVPYPLGHKSACPQAGLIGIMLILREKKSPYPDRLQVTQDFVIKSELFRPISCSKLQKN